MIFIPFNTPSSKNSRIFNIKLKRSLPSKLTSEYMKNTSKIYKEEKDNFLKLIEDKEKPYKIEFSFNRKDKRKFDLINAAQIVQDLMVKYEWLEDDNYTILHTSFGNVTIDKEKPGVIIKVL
jgi:hypothetical protein